MTAALTELLCSLRETGQQAAHIDPALVPTTLEQAYAVQAAVARTVPGGARGWKAGMTNAAAMRARNMTHPVYARLFNTTTFEGHGSLPAIKGRKMFEAEYVFELGRDLPKGDYSHDALIDAIRAVRPGLEICGSRLATTDPVPLLLSLADNSMHLGMVIGPPLENWQDRYLDEPVTLADQDGNSAQGSGRDVLDDPLNILRWLASVDLPDGGLKAGDLIASGAATKLDIVATPASARAQFGDDAPISAALT